MEQGPTSPPTRLELAALFLSHSLAIAPELVPDLEMEARQQAFEQAWDVLNEVPVTEIPPTEREGHATHLAVVKAMIQNRAVPKVFAEGLITVPPDALRATVAQTANRVRELLAGRMAQEVEKPAALEPSPAALPEVALPIRTPRLEEDFSEVPPRSRSAKTVKKAPKKPVAKSSTGVSDTPASPAASGRLAPSAAKARTKFNKPGAKPKDSLSETENRQVLEVYLQRKRTLPPGTPSADSNWRLWAMCYGAKAELFQAAPNTSEERVAKAICALCPAKPECLQEALTRPDEIGIWGGTNRWQRGRIRGKAQRAAKAGPQPRGDGSADEANPDFDLQQE